MKIYFVGSIAGKEKYLSNYKRIISHLKKLGHTVLENTLIPTKNYVYSMDTIKKMDQWNCVRNWIIECDLMIAEVSYPSIGIGFELATAASFSKKALALYTIHGAQHFIQGIPSEYLTVLKYDLENLDRINDHITIPKFELESSLNVYLPVNVINEIDRKASKENLSRAQLFIKNFS